MLIKTFFKYYHSIRYLKLSQSLGRVYAIIKRTSKLYKLPKSPSNLNCNLNLKSKFLFTDPWTTREEILKGNYTFFNIEKNLGNPVEWNKTDIGFAWKFSLNCFNYIFLLNDNDKYNLIMSWISDNPLKDSVAWHPYTISYRIVSWIKAGNRSQEILKSLYIQASYLYRNLEYYLGGNHYLENIKALIFAGMYFGTQGEAPKWLNKGLLKLNEQTKEQILNDGGHFERSPVYHANMLVLYLDIFNILDQKNIEKLNLTNVISKMSNFLRSVTHPQGEIALFNDSSEEMSLPSDKILNYSLELLNEESTLKSKFEDSGYYLYRDSEAFLIIDGGPIGPDYLPGHSHADIFSYELSVKNKKIVVDCGAYDYTPGEMRDYVRSTRAHNTISIDNKDQAEMWNSHRVARRYKPFIESFEQSSDGIKFRGRFDGYAKLIGDNLIHNREIICQTKDKKIIVNDIIYGNGQHLVESMIHFHPEIEIEDQDGIILLKSNNSVVYLDIFTSNFRIENSWYTPKMGVKINNKAITISGEGDYPQYISYQFRY